MKLRLIIFSATLLFLSYAPVYCQDWMRSTKYLNGFRYTVRITEPELKALPSWNPETEDVPLSARKAVEIARTNLARLMLKANDEWELDAVNLTRIGKDKWIYEVDFLCPSKMFVADEDWSFSVFVKINGTILEPEIVLNDGKVRIY